MAVDQYYWSWPSLLLYLLLALFGTICFRRAKRTMARCLLNRYYISLYSVWLFFTVWREVSPGIGGTDAYGYADYFVHCLDEVQANIYSYRTEMGWQLLNKAIRIFTNDYHVLFIIVYSVIIWAIIYFIHEFYYEHASYIPLTFCFYEVLISFNIIRNGFAIGLLLISVVRLYKDNNISAVLFAILGISMHSATVFYAGFLPFYWLYKRRINIGIGSLLIWSMVGATICRIIQRLILAGQFTFINRGTPIDVYASASLSSGFFDDWWKIVVSQLMLIIAVVVLRERILRYVERQPSDLVKKRLRYVKLLVYYDLLLVPSAYILHVWRAVDYFLLPRIILWGVVISVLCRLLSQAERRIVPMVGWMAIISYMVLRIYTTYDISCLMPYAMRF